MLAVAAVEAGILASRAGFAPGRKGGGLRFAIGILCSVAATQTRPVPLRFLDTYCS